MNQFKFKQFKRWLAGLSFVIGIPMAGYAESGVSGFSRWAWEMSRV